ncbi:hypothetical protein X742_30775 [Mesorhizobium sp. LNHC232B00]|nr:hypothetical protein X742_30775 [Mesorhizobium sp. LNHC232B00]
MSDTVSIIASPDNQRLRFSKQFDLDDTWFSSRPAGAFEPIEDTVAIRNKQLCPRGIRLPFAQVPFLTDDKLDVLSDEIDSISRLDQLRDGRASKTRIDLNYNRAPLRPPEFNVHWSPAETKPSQTAQADIGNSLTLLICQPRRISVTTKDEMRWGAEVPGGNPDDLTPHYLHAVIRALREFFHQHSRRRPPRVFSIQQKARMFCQLIDIAAQTDTTATAAYRWL